MVSFTFEDAPVGAARVDAHMLEQYGARGTFYIAGGLVDAWSGNWTGTTIEARGTRAGVGHFSYANGPRHHIFEIWRVGNLVHDRR